METLTLKEFVKSHGHGGMTAMAQTLGVSTQAVDILLRRVPSDVYKPVYLRVMNNVFGTDYQMEDIPWIPEKKRVKFIDMAESMREQKKPLLNKKRIS